MKFFFCETCGKRITEEETANKQVKGMYCKGCAASVMTMEFTALTNNDVATALKKPPSSSHPASALSETGRHRRPTAEAAAARPSRGQRQSAPETEAPAPTNTRLYAGIAAGVGAAVGLVVLFALRGNSQPPPAGPAAKAAAPSSTAIEKPAPVPASPAQPPKPPAVAAPAATKTERPLSADERADKAFEQLKTALNGVGADNIAEKEKLANAFLKDHGETILASRVRTMVASWRAPAEPPPPPPASVTAATPVEPGEVLKELFNGKDTEGWTPHGTTKGKYHVEDGMLVFDESVNGLLHTKSPSRDYTVEVELFLEDNTGSYLEIKTRLGSVGINRASTKTWLKVLVTVKGNTLQARQLQTPHKGTLEILPHEGNDLFGFFTSGKGKKKVRAIRVVAEKN